MTHASVGVARGILRNAAALFLVGAFAKGAGLIIAVFVARFLGADAMGLFAALFSISVLIETFISLGMSDSLVRDVASRPDEAAGMYRGALKLVALISVIPAIGLAVAAFAADAYPSARASLVILAVGTPISGACVVAQAILQGAERVFLLTWVTFVARVASLALLFVAFARGAGLEAAFASRVLFHLLCLGVFSLVLLRSARKAGSVHSTQHLLTRAVPFAVNKGIRELSVRLPSLMLPAAVGLAGAGIFDSANRIRSTLSMTMSASVIGLMPAFARNAQDSVQDSSATLIGYSVKYMCFGMALIGTVVAVLSDWIIRLLFGTEFAAAAIPLQLLTWTQVLNGVDAVLQQAMLARAAVGPAIRNSAIGAAVQFALLIALSAWWGLPGAALGVLLSSVATLSIDLRYVVRQLVTIRVWHFAVAPLIATLAVAVVLFALSEAGVAMRAGAAIGTWAVAMASFRLLPRQELEFIRRLVGPARAPTVGDG
jgi:O-antigen/teichoic acid export membrane protein